MKNKKSFSNFFFRPEFRGLVILLLLLLNAITIAQEQTPAPNEFIIGIPIFHELSTNPDIFNSFVAMGMNTIHQRADNDTKNLLGSYNLVAYNTKNESEYIHYYSSAYYSKWEAEQNLTGEDTARVGFKHKGGQSAYWYDSELNDTVLCWSTEGLATPACSLMYGPHYRQDKLYKRWYGNNDRYDLKYTPRFRMALDNHGGAGLNEDVCVIKVVFRYKNPDDSLHYDTTFIARTLKVGDFDTSGKFDDFYLHANPDSQWYEYYPGFILPEKFTLMEGSPLPVNFIDWESFTGIQFWVDWLMDDNLCTLYIDYAEVYDNDGWDEYIIDPERVDSIIISYAEGFKNLGWNNIKYWGGTDEPYSIDCYTPIRVVDELIRSVQAPPLVVNFQPTWWHTLDVNGEDEIAMFYNIAKPSKITLSTNPCSANWDVIRYEDFEWLRFNLQRTSALDPNFWFHVQAHGMRMQTPPIPANAGWCVWRKPEPPEFLAMSMLGLAHGAKGIIALWLDSFEQTIDRGTCIGRYMEAMVDEDGTPIPDSSYSLYYTLKDNIVPRLKGKLGKTLIKLDYTGNYLQLQRKEYEESATPVGADYLTLSPGIPEDLEYNWHCGLFIDSTAFDDNYFLLANLITTDQKNIRVKVQTQASYPINYRFRNVEGLFDTTVQAPNYLVKLLTYPPGEGYLYEFAPVIKYGGRLLYDETISSTTTLLDEMTIEDDAMLTVNNTYNVDRTITIKDNGSIITTSGGTMKFYNDLSLVIEGSVTISGTAQHKLILDFLSPADSNGIIIKPGGSLTISYCEIKNAGTGIFSELNADSLIVEYVDFIDCEDNSISIAGRSGEENVPIRIENCTIENSEYGIYVNNTSSILIRWNEITDTDCGIYLSNVSDALMLLNNIASSNEELQGILSLSSGGIIYGNTINGFTSAIQLGNSSPKIGVNTITGNKYHGIYVGTGSNPYMKAAYLGNPVIPYGLSGYNTIYENGGYQETGGPADNDGSEIFFYNSTAALDSGCNIIKDDRSVSPPLINTLRLMTRTSGGFPITLYARNNFWGDTVYSSRFYGMNVIYTPYRTEPCAIPGGGGEEDLIMMDQFGNVIDTIYTTGMAAPELSETESAYAEAEEYFLTGDLNSALQVYESIISSGATDDEKYFAYERKYTIGKLQNESPEYFNNLSGVFSNLAANTEDSLAIKRLTQLSTLSKVAEQEYETAINEFDGIIQQNPSTEEAVYAEIDALTTALLIEDADSTLHKGRLGKYLTKSSSDYHRKVNDILRKNFGGSSKDNERELLPTEYILYQNYPNPFNPTTTIKYDLPDASDVSLIIYDILGRKVKELVNTKQPAGKYEIQFDASNLASGIYIYQLIADKFISSKKMILLK